MKCKTCNGTGKVCVILGDDTLFNCPTCKGTGKVEKPSIPSTGKRKLATVEAREVSIPEIKKVSEDRNSAGFKYAQRTRGIHL